VTSYLTQKAMLYLYKDQTLILFTNGNVRYSVSHMKTRIKLCGQNSGLLLLKHVVNIITTFL